MKTLHDAEPAAAAALVPTRAAIEAAQRRIGADVRATPLWRVDPAQLGLRLADGVQLWLKLEQLQRGGSFKARGLFNHLRSAAAAGALPAAGAAIASGGNAGIAAAEAAQALGVPVDVFVPAATPPAKLAALAARGARVHAAGAGYAEALAACQAHQQASGALALHAYDLPEMVEGAGTLAAEVDAQLGAAPDRVLVSVGGGGLVAGLAAWWGGRAQDMPATRVEALEPEGCPTLHAALQAGGPVDVEVGGIAADALGARRIGRIAWAARGHLAGAHLLPPQAVADAQALLWRALRLAVEPAAALPLAALACGAVQPQAGERVVLVVCGANLDPTALAPRPETPAAPARWAGAAA